MTRGILERRPFAARGAPRPGQGCVPLLGTLACPCPGVGPCGSRQHTHWHTPSGRRHRGGLERLGFSDSSGRLIGLRNPQTPRAGFPHGSGACRLPCEPPACRGGRKTVCVVGKVSPAEAGGSHAEVGAAGLRGTGRASAWELGCRSTAGFSQPPEHRSLLWQTAALTASRRKAKKMPLPLCWKSFWFLDG